MPFVPIIVAFNLLRFPDAVYPIKYDKQKEYDLVTDPVCMRVQALLTVVLMNWHITTCGQQL